MCATHYFFACYIIIRHTDALLICMNFKQLPMQKNSTHLITKECNGTQQSSVKPRKSTIEFLKQFARAYTYQQQMPYQLGGFIAN